MDSAKSDAEVSLLFLFGICLFAAGAFAGSEVSSSVSRDWFLLFADVCTIRCCFAFSRRCSSVPVRCGVADRPQFSPKVLG